MITQIAGIVSLDGSAPSEARMQTMLAAMNPLRRKAANRAVRAGPALFGAVQIASGHSGIGPPVLVAGGEILFTADAKLWDPASVGRSGDETDAAALARLVQDQGGGVSASVNGDFAWARWDGAGLTLARDHFGVRPLYYTVRSGRWAAFASSPAALLQANLARPALDLASALNFAANNSPLKGRSFQRDIATQRPGHLTRIALDGSVEEQRYWRLPIGPRISERTDPEEVAAEIRRLLDQAVRRRLPATGPVGGHLSGGLDSSPLAVAAAREIRPHDRQFTAYSFEEPRGTVDFELVDEGPYVAETVAAEPNISLVAISEPGFVGPLLGPYDPALLEPVAEDEPEHQVLAHAEATGIDTLFSGWGGDQVVSYNARYPAAELFLHGHWGLMQAELSRFRARLPSAFYYQVVLPLLAEPWRSRLTRLTRRSPEAPRQRPLFRPPGLPEADPPEHAVPPEGRSFLARREMCERNFIQHRLAHFAHLGAPRGIRYVFPLLDLDLVGYAMRLPAHFLVRDGLSRRLLRDAARGLVPERVRLRTAKLFPHSLDSLRLPLLRDEFDRRLAAIRPNGLAARAVDVPALRAALRRDVDTPDTTRERMREHAARGEQLYLPAFNYLAALQLALALDDYERRHGLDAALPLSCADTAE